MKSIFLISFLLFLETFVSGSDFISGENNMMGNSHYQVPNFILNDLQVDDNKLIKSDNLIINSDSRIDTLIQIQREESHRKGGIDGYRVQIFQGTKENAYQAKARFISRHEDIKVYVLFQSPDFRVRVGDFRTRSEALKVKHLIENEFSTTFVIEDLIIMPGLETIVSDESITE